MSASDTLVTIANQALSSIGNRSIISTLSEQSNEAIQVNLVINDVIQELLRMAPWNCAFNTNTLQLITATPGTPENPSTGPIQWNKSLPAPPWSYEYAYPGDCLRACWIVPQYMTGFASGVPITTAVTGGSPSYWNGPPARFKVAIDQPITIMSAAVATGGTGYTLNDTIVIGHEPGVPCTLTVTGVSAGAVTAVSVFIGGSFLVLPTNPMNQIRTSGAGTGASFNVVFSPTIAGVPVDQRVILTNQEFAIMAYIRSTVAVSPSVWDSQFAEAVIHRLGSRLVYATTGDKALANERIKHANELIMAARATDANEGITINDVTPDWIRNRGIVYAGDYAWSPNTVFDWGSLLTMY
jgi:hypothetical protein